MKAFSIEKETNNISVHTSTSEAEAAAQSEHFSNEAEFAGLAAKWPAARLVEIWNTMPGETPVKKFKDRTTAVARIWKALQSLAQSVPLEFLEEAEQNPEGVLETETVPPLQDLEGGADLSTANAPQSPRVATEGVALDNPAMTEKDAPKPATRKAREGSKTDAILALMKSAGGATLKAIIEATGWQAHSVRGFISGTLTKKMGLRVVSAKGENGERTYTISA